MENAAKALLFAGEILIGVLILSLFVYVFYNFMTNTKDMEQRYTVEEAIKINTKLEKNLNDKMSVQDVVTIIHEAQEFNIGYDNQKEANGNKSKMEIYVDNEEYTNKDEEKLIEDLIKKRLETTYSFKCTKIEYNDITNIANRIYIKTESN